ncbi:WXG100 family type VII secretion target [Nocardioides sp. HM23]|uniref:WXG100 family type VII secretion target n=1 Tax=Nocardioides bizhenqiangii TaxID=3095076 RepID=UPI002ACA7DE6|nr:WXG100 family type VII secretion target [Nocardioides sp. HM23]MDZ5619215.1 WXG100 family type VII secretion target [Nocardioides sp. HM23]
MADHYTLNLDPQQLRNVAKFLGEAEAHVRSKGQQVAGTPGEIGGQWTGEAATAIKAEMGALGGVMTGGDGSFSVGLGDAQQALTTLAGHFDTAQEELAALNTRWSTAQSDYDDAPIGDHDPDGGGETAGERRDRLQGSADADFEELKTWCRERVKECGETIALSSPISYYGYNGSTLSYGTNPDTLLPLLTLTDQRHDLLQQQEQSRQEGKRDAEHLQELLNGREAYDSDELREFMASIAEHADDPDYAAAFVRAGGSKLLKDAYDAAANDLAVQGGGLLSQEDWEGPLQALNDVYAAGLEVVDGTTLGKITADLGSAKYIGILTAITGSDYAGPRTNSAVLPYAHYLGDQIPGGSTWDMTRWMSQLANGEKSVDEIIQGYRDNMLDPKDLAVLVNEMDSASRDRWISELLSDGGDPYDEQVTRNWNEILPGLLDAARDEEALGALGALLGQLDSRPPPADATYDLGKFFTDPKTIDLLAQYPESLDDYQDDIASLFGKYVGKKEVNQLLKDMIARDLQGEGGIEASAKHIGYILGLAEAAHVDYNVGELVKPIAGQIRSELQGQLAELIKTGGTTAAKTIPVLNVAIAALDAIVAEAGKDDAARKKFEEGWKDEDLHQTMAWLLYLQRNGAPDSYERWKEQANVAGNDPLLEPSQYMGWLSNQPEGSPEYELWLELNDLSGRIGDAHK